MRKPERTKTLPSKFNFDDTVNRLVSVLNAKNILLQKSEALQSNTTTKPVTDTVKLETNNHQEDVFLKLVVSWKQTRELALLSGCKKAVEVADEMFPFLSPTVCAQKNTAVTNRGAENV